VATRMVLWLSQRLLLMLLNNLDSLFSEVFPGSRTPLAFEDIRKVKEEVSESWDAKPLIFTVKGKQMEFFSIGQLGRALGNRSANTLRAWEKDAILPITPYRKPSRNADDPDPRGSRRMYSRAMVEGLIKIAKEEGIWLPDKGRKLSQTRFTMRATELFQALLKSQ